METATKMKRMKKVHAFPLGFKIRQVQVHSPPEIVFEIDFFKDHS